MYSVRVIINNDGRLALRLIENRWHHDENTVNEKHHADSHDGGSRVITLDICDEDVLDRGAIVIKN